MLSREYCQRLDTRDLLGTSGKVFENPSAPVESSTSIYRGVLHGRNHITTFDGSVFSSTGKLVTKSEDVNKDTLYRRRDSQGSRQLGTLHLKLSEIVESVVS